MEFFDGRVSSASFGLTNPKVKKLRHFPSTLAGSDEPSGIVKYFCCVVFDRVIECGRISPYTMILAIISKLQGGVDRMVRERYQLVLSPSKLRTYIHIEWQE